MPEAFNPSRLRLARKRRGLTKGQLVSKAGLSMRALVAYERGEKEPGTQSLGYLSRALTFPVEFFNGPDLEEPREDGTSFRALSTLTAKHRDQSLTSGALALCLSDWIEGRFDLPIPNIPRYQGVDPETAAQAVRTEWNLGERPIDNMIHLLEAHGVRVFSIIEDCHQMDAFSFWRGTAPHVFLNTMKSAEHSRLDGAHELGHLVLHWKGGVRGRDAEREAQMFGAAFLMPRGSVIAEAPRSGKLNQLVKAKRRWNVSVAALAYRMHELKLLTGWQYRSLFIEISRNGYRKSEPNPCQNETSQVLAKVFKALREDGLTMADVADALNIYPDELNKLIFGLVLTPVAGMQSSVA